MLVAAAALAPPWQPRGQRGRAGLDGCGRGWPEAPVPVGAGPFQHEAVPQTCAVLASPSGLSDATQTWDAHL